ISLDEFTERVLSIWHSSAKNPQAGVRQDIRDYHQGKTLIFLDANTVVPTQLGLAGVRFRAPLSRQEVDQGLLFVYPTFQFLLPEDSPAAEIQLVDEADHAIPADIVMHRVRVEGLFGPSMAEVSALNLGWWYRKHNVKRQDSLLVTILDWAASKFRLQIESVQDRRRMRTEIEEANQQLDDALFGLLEVARYERARGMVAIPTAYARLKDETAYPADHWLEVIQNDPRMEWSGYDIRYPEDLSLMERIIPELRQEQSPGARAELSPEQAEQVYRFKAYYKYRKGLWRRIEIQGGQTLSEFDDILRDAFQHDRADHLSGFWHLVRRGNTRRFREVDLGSINPFEGGDGADVQVASIGLEPGDRLKYVYDFGDWYEYRIELEAIEAPEADADYPRVTAQNRPRYRYCPVCKEQGRKTIATYICVDCSNMRQEQVLVCEDHIYPEHEVHYLDEIVY
ncbi:MAG TPA: hypothetical protein VF177_15345, partial [Anaerolineae bacterium]